MASGGVVGGGVEGGGVEGGGGCGAARVGVAGATALVAASAAAAAAAPPPTAATSAIQHPMLPSEAATKSVDALEAAASAPIGRPKTPRVCPPPRACSRGAAPVSAPAVEQCQSRSVRSRPADPTMILPSGSSGDVVLAPGGVPGESARKTLSGPSWQPFTSRTTDHPLAVGEPPPMPPPAPPLKALLARSRRCPFCKPVTAMPRPMTRMAVTDAATGTLAMQVPQPLPSRRDHTCTWQAEPPAMAARAAAPGRLPGSERVASAAMAPTAESPPTRDDAGGCGCPPPPCITMVLSPIETTFPP